MKLVPIFIAIMLAISGLGAVAIYPTMTTDNDFKNLERTVQFSTINIENNEEKYIKISLEKSESFLMNPGKPLLPRVTKTFELPFGATNIDVRVDISQKDTQSINKQVRPSPAPLPLSPDVSYNPPPKKDESIYQSKSLYPSQSHTYNTVVGLNDEFEHVTFVNVHLYPVRYTPADYELTIVKKADIHIAYTPPETTPFPQTSSYDLAIITPSVFSNALQPLIDHKNDYGVETMLKTTEEIYSEYDGFDEAEQIKYFIKDALEEFNIKYVLLVGGLKSTIYAKPRDNANIGATGWHVPVRYSNVRAGGDPGFPTDLYYADVYKEGGAFETWDSDGDGILAEWYLDEETNAATQVPEDIIDYAPDVAVGRIASSDVKEVSEVVNKIITYETTTYGSDWFKETKVYSGDGFLDQFDLNIQWDTSEVEDGSYTICAQSFNDENESGPIDEITVTVDKTMESDVTFNHDDHLNPVLEQGYPAPPIAEIVSVSDGNILGNTDVTYEPSEGKAYCNTLFWWANVSYVDEVLIIRGKSYDPQPYGNITDIHVWVENSEGETVFSDWRTELPTYYEGEWVTGEESVNGRGGALHYMPEEFEKEIIWTSNGKFTGMEDVMEAFSEGSGFAFFSGHGSPGYWGDQTPGIPGNRGPASVHGLVVSNIHSFPPFLREEPLWPMDELSNTGKLPV
ncbi:MAG: C25 family cysteine peptidase, partial [Thermoplasmatota archaeon]